MGPAEEFGFVCRGEGDTAASWAAGWRLLTSLSVGSKETQEGLGWSRRDMRTWDMFGEDLIR